MDPLANRMINARNDQRQWRTAAVLSVLPVLLVAYVCCNYEPSELLAGLFLVEWMVILAVWRWLCPWLGCRSVVLAAVPFLVSCGISALLARETLAVHGAIWAWSDDWWYLTEASRVVDALSSSGWNLAEAWAELTSVWMGSAWTLAGWSFLLGLVGSAVSSDPSLELLHAVALSLNATFLSLVLALVYHVLREPAQRFPWMVLACVVLVSGDPIIYAAMSRKESMLQLVLMMAFVSSVKLSDRIQVPWLMVWLIGMAGVATTRPAYVPLILLILYWRGCDRIRLGVCGKVAIGLVLLLLLRGLVLGFQIREVPVSDLLSGKTLEADAGIAMGIYNIPVVGPALFYAISPVPVLPWNILSFKEITATMIRSVGSVAWFFATGYVLCGVIRNRLLQTNRLYVAAAMMFAGLFIAVVLAGDDPRYKQPTNFYLAILLFLTWYDKRIRKPRNG